MSQSDYRALADRIAQHILWRQQCVPRSPSISELQEWEKAFRALASEPTQGGDDELPGMWSLSDFTGSDPDERSYAERKAAEPAESGYRLLRVGERIEIGDQLYSDAQRWRPADLYAGTVVDSHTAPIRRLVQPLRQGQATDFRMLAYELEGVIADVELKDKGAPGFDTVCLSTLKRVRNELLSHERQGQAVAVVKGGYLAWDREYLATTPPSLPDGTKLYTEQPASEVVAPWPDFLGQPVRHGDRLVHPDGTEFVAIRLDGSDESEAWLAVYGHSQTLRLCLQIGDKGRAVLAAAPAKPASAAVVDDMVPASALRDLYAGYVKTLEAGMDRIASLGGDCDPVETMERTDPYLIRARKLLAAAPDRAKGGA